MTALLVLVLCAAFIVLDVAVRALGKRMDAARERAEREAVLKTSVNLTIAGEARSLKRAEVPNAKARILAVDDEAVILDSFRKILVLSGFSVDTVQSGPEALMLVRQNDYDFVFTDLKMPEMSGVDVVKSVKHLRPDIDVAVITGFGTIETAVETVSHGAVDFVQKPFTEEELVAFANRLLIKRQARIDSQSKPAVHVVSPSIAEAVAGRDYCVPGGAFVSPVHAWAQIEADGGVCVGLDDFARKAIEKVERLDLPAKGARLKRDDVLCVVRRGEDMIRIRSPLSGEVVQVNDRLQAEPALVVQSPYDRGWVCVVRPSDLSADLQALRIGNPVIAWYQDEVTRLRRDTAESPGGVLRWAELDRRFFDPERSAAKPAETASVG